MKKSNGVTLITLVITITVVIILGAVAILNITGQNGLVNRSQIANEETNKKEVEQKLGFVFQEALIEQTKNKDYNSNEFLDQFITSRIANAEVDENFVIIGQYEFEIDRENLKILNTNKLEKERDTNTKNNSLLGEIAKISKAGQYEVEVIGKTTSGTEETIIYNVNAIVFRGNLVLDGITPVKGATLIEETKTYEFGDNTTDVATASENAKNMVVVKVEGDIIVNEGVTLTACKSDGGFGGPKGMTIYCRGTITNNGTISMTERGAKATGENVYLWQNEDGTYEYVPAVGASGGGTQSPGRYSAAAGKTGGTASGRATGGGGSGAAFRGATRVTYSGAGGAGTSYSGGAGSGAATYYSTAGGASKYTAAGSSVGGAGSNALASHKPSGGGAGNPGGSGSVAGGKGTGGLLIIYSNKIINNKDITAHGVSGGKSTYGGGSSGGGSINVFYRESIENTGSIQANGGAPVGNTKAGGKGGQGTSTITQI